MEPVGLAVGIAGLAGLFSSCLEVIENVDSYRDFEHDSRSLAAQFDADKLRFEQWGRSIGVEKGQLAERHHHALDDPEVLSMAKELLYMIMKISKDSDDAFPRRGRTTNPIRPNDTVQTESKRQKLAWALRGKRKRTAQVEQFSILVQQLHSLVPLDAPREAAVRSTYDSQPTQGSIQATILKKTLLKIEEEIEAETRRDLHTWLSRQSSTDLYNDAIQKSVPKTCSWILSRPEFTSWVMPNTTGQDSKLLWVTAPAGFGKTILCASVVEHLQSTLKTHLAYFFLSSSFESRSDPYSVIRSWIAQVISHDQTAFELARERWLTQDEQIATRTTIVALFQDIVYHVPGCTLILDGLDECTWIGENREGRNSITGFIEAMGQAVADTNTRLMIASRDEPELRRVLTCMRGFSELRISSQDVQHDVLLFSRSIVDRKLPKKDEVTKIDVSLKMADRSEGQFIWVRMQENSLRSWKNKRQLEDAIDKAPAQLEYVYERNWTRMSQLPDEERTRAYNLLRWAAFALRPLSVCEITEAVLIDNERNQLPVEELPDSVDEEYIDNEILGPCGSLLEVRETLSGNCETLKTVHLAHFSIKQYFLSHTSAQGELLMSNHKFQCSNDALENARLGALCLRYVNYRGVWEDSPDTRATQIKQSFREYAASTWSEHATISGGNETALVELIIGLFNTDNPNWEPWRKYRDSKKKLRISTYVDEIPATPLHYAAELGFAEVLRHIMQSSTCAIDEKRSFGSALTVASEKGNVSVVDLLLKEHADVTTTDIEDWAPLHMASYYGHLEVANLLLRGGADVM
ncbi:prion-inhibition and propagation-domain-containing protein, partial [Dactylonectria macrodidyma]